MGDLAIGKGGEVAAADRVVSKDALAVRSVASVHLRLREAIITGEIEPGTVTSQVALAEELGVGRTPLREALRHLQSEGFVAGESNKRVRVSELSWDDAEELYIAIILLETSAVRLTVPHLGSSDIAEMRGYIAQMDHYSGDGDWAALRGSHRAFHAKLVAHGGPRICGIIDAQFDHADRYRFAQLPSTTEQWAGRQAEHRDLVAAASDGDPDLTAQRLAQHYLNSGLRILRRMDPSRSPSRLHEALGGASGA